ncbi:MAG: hypothetical protein ACRDJU_09135, partial [Actinomycetota bacterium]
MSPDLPFGYPDPVSPAVRSPRWRAFARCGRSTARQDHRKRTMSPTQTEEESLQQEFAAPTKKPITEVA